jgi:hypothetical protein
VVRLPVGAGCGARLPAAYRTAAGQVGAMVLVVHVLVFDVQFWVLGGCSFDQCVLPLCYLCVQQFWGPFL